MFKSKMTLKLARNFALALLVFAFLVGGVFYMLHRSQTLETRKIDLINYASSLANTLQEEDQTNFKGMGRYMHLMNDLTLSDIWLVDENMKYTSFNRRGQGHKNVNSQTLPTDVSSLIEEVFQGEIITNDNFSSMLDSSTLTVGVPIFNNQQKVIGAVLLHAPINTIYKSAESDFKVFLFSIILGFILSLLLALVLSYSFTRPLKVMNKTASSLAAGNYQVASNLKQNDEIGELSFIIDELANKLEFASQERNKLDQMRQDFMTNISHELKTPIAVIRGSLEALRDKIISDPKQVEEYQTQVLNEIKHLERLVLDLLDLSRLENLDYKIDYELVNLKDVLLDVTRSGSKLALNKEIDIITKIDSDKSQISGDYGRLRQMFLIVLDNAVKYSPFKGKIIMELNQNIITIIDQGPGIQESEIPNLFERYYQGNNKTQESGTGLGLAIANEIAKRHQIEISAENNETIGLKVKFILNF